MSSRAYLYNRDFEPAEFFGGAYSFSTVGEIRTIRDGDAIIAKNGVFVRKGDSFTVHDPTDGALSVQIEHVRCAGAKASMRWGTLSEIHPHPRDSSVRFQDAGHTYTVNGKRVTNSVSKVAGKMFPPFIAPAVIRRALAAGKWADERSPYYRYLQTSPTDDDAVKTISALWTAKGVLSAARGTAAHRAIERYLNVTTPSPAPKAKEAPTMSVRAFELAKLFDVPADLAAMAFDRAPLPPIPSEMPAGWDAWAASRARDLHPYRTEWSVYSSRAPIAGQIDAVFVNDLGQFVLVDWKCIDAFQTDGFGRFAKAPLDDIPDTNVGKYSVQLNIYAHILEEDYDMTIVEMRLVRFHENAPDGFEELVVDRIPKGKLNEVFASVADTR